LYFLSFIRRKRQRVDEEVNADEPNHCGDGAKADQASLDHSYHLHLPDCDDVSVDRGVEHTHSGIHVLLICTILLFYQYTGKKLVLCTKIS